MSRKLAAVFTAVLAFTGAACGNDSDDDRVGATVPPGSPPPNDTTTTTTTEAEESEAEEAAREYFEALATNDLSRMGAMLELAADDSPASLYATHQIALVRADATGPVAAADTEWSPDSVEVCEEGFDLTGETVTECVTFADFEISDDGLLVTFTVNDAPISDHIAAGETIQAQGVAVRVVTAYQTARGDVALNVDVVNNRATPLSLAEYDWTYVTADGRQVQSSEVGIGLLSDIAPGATAGTTVVFEQAPLGGTLRFVAFEWESDDFDDYEVRFDVPVPASGVEQ